MPPDDSRTSVLIVGGPSGKTHTLVHPRRGCCGGGPARVRCYFRAAAAARWSASSRSSAAWRRVRSGTFHAGARAAARAPYHRDEEEKLLLLTRRCATCSTWRSRRAASTATKIVRPRRGPCTALTAGGRAASAAWRAAGPRAAKIRGVRRATAGGTSGTCWWGGATSAPPLAARAFRHVLIDEVQTSTRWLEILDAARGRRAAGGHRGRRPGHLRLPRQPRGRHPDFEKRHAPAAQQVLATRNPPRRWRWHRPSSPRTRGASSAPSSPWWTPRAWRGRPSSLCRRSKTR